MNKNQPVFDFLVIGGGIVGLASARQLQRQYPDARVLLVEKENAIAQHQTGHNSGVIHAGVYYAPGSLKADFCRRGAQATKQFCLNNDIPFDTCGKLLVATNELEQQRMQTLYNRCVDNGIDVKLQSQQELHAREPNIRGIGAIWVPETAVVNYQQICQRLSEQFVEAGGQIEYGQQVINIEEGEHHVTAYSRAHFYCGKFLLSCAGLMADRLAALMNAKIAINDDLSDNNDQKNKSDKNAKNTSRNVNQFKIIPFRGEYYRLPGSRQGIINHLIYPIPDPELPFLGVHLTKTIDGGVTVGPNAVLGFKREGYGRFNFNATDTWDIVTFKGMLPLIKNHWRSGFSELLDSWSKLGYLKRVQKYCPQLKSMDLQPVPAGVRAQAVLPNGELVHDFLFAETSRSLHVCNAPSPAATSAFPIAEYLVNTIDQSYAQ